MVDDDARDERLAAWLEPEPLDDLTRRRLVSTAMRQSRDSRATRWIAAAAAIVVVLVGVLALITAQGGNDEHDATSAVRAPTSSAAGAQAPSGAAADSALPESSASATAAPAPVAVGEFGDLDRAANRARLRTALEGSREAFASGKAAADASDLAASDLAVLPCRDQLPAGTVTAVGTGTLDGRSAVVVLTELGDGRRSIDAVLRGPCEIRPLP